MLFAIYLDSTVNISELFWNFWHFIHKKRIIMLINMASTRSKSSSSKNQNTKAEDSDLISLNMVKDYLKFKKVL